MGLEWWQEPLRVLQYNLQVKDTGKMIPCEIAEDAAGAGANAVVINVGGIYAWYGSRIPFHHINEYLPEGGHLLEELIRCCHGHGLRVIGRFDFSKAEDTTYLQRPGWFVQDREGKPVCYGKERMGGWPLLFSTCINGGYRNQEFAAKVLGEALEMFQLDGVFFNAPQMEPCHCLECRRKYRKLYGEELPEAWGDRRGDWASRCLADNMALLCQAVKRKKPDAPVILYYGTYREDGAGEAEDLKLRYGTADLICTEAQDILSAGKRRFPASWKPSLNMKLGQEEGRPKPLGIIHSCPGMDFRHTGLPSAEYEFWMSQIPAAGGQIWHSLTGFGAVITDRRMLPVVERVNRKAAQSDGLMRGSESAAQVALIWQAGSSELGFVEGFMACHIPFDILYGRELGSQALGRYQVVVLPGGFLPDGAAAESLRQYVEAGGSLFVEWAEEGSDLLRASLGCGLLGIGEELAAGREAEAAYAVLEPAGSALRQGLGENRYIPVRGNVLYAHGVGEARTLLSFVPPFAPLDGVGAPPERASIPVPHTDIPLLLLNPSGRGRVMSCFFQLSRLIAEIGLPDHKRLFANCIVSLMGGEALFAATHVPEGVFVYLYRSEGRLLLQLVNGIGSRPLSENIPCYGLEFEFRLPGGFASDGLRAYSALEGAEVEAMGKGDVVRLRLERLVVWDLVVLEWI